MRRWRRATAWAYVVLHLAGTVGAVFAPSSWLGGDRAAVDVSRLCLAVPFAVLFAMLWVLLIRGSSLAWWVLLSVTLSATVLLILGGAFRNQLGNSNMWWLVLYPINGLFLNGLVWWVEETGFWFGPKYGTIAPVLTSLIIYATASIILLTDRPRGWRRSSEAAG